MPDVNDTSGSAAGTDKRADRPAERFAMRFVHRHVSYDSTLAERDPEWIKARAERVQRYIRFHQQQLALGAHGLVALAKLAEMYAADRCGALPDPPAELLAKHRHAAYQHMAEDILGRRRFVRNGKSRALFLDPDGPPRFLTAESLKINRLSG